MLVALIKLPFIFVVAIPAFKKEPAYMLLTSSSISEDRSEASSQLEKCFMLQLFEIQYFLLQDAKVLIILNSAEPFQRYFFFFGIFSAWYYQLPM